METNKYYTLIEKLVKNHRKYAILGDSYSEVVQNVYDIAKPVLLSASDESSVEKYLVKLVSVTILKMSKNIGVEKNHQTIENKMADYNNETESGLDTEIDILSTEKNEISEQEQNILQVEENFSSDLSVILTNQTESDLKEENQEIINDLFTTDVIDDLYNDNCDINVSEQNDNGHEMQNADAKTGVTESIQDDECEAQQYNYKQPNIDTDTADPNIIPARDVEPNKDLVDKMINGAIKDATNDLFESTADFFQDNNKDNELSIKDENIITENQESIFEISVDSIADDDNVSKEEIVRVEIQKSNTDIDSDIMEFNVSDAEISTELVQDFGIEYNSDIQEPLEPEIEPSVEFLNTDVQEFVTDEDNSGIQMFSETENLQISDEINIDDNLQDDNINLNEKISLELDNNEGDLNLDISSEEEIDFDSNQQLNFDNTDMNLVEYTKEDSITDIHENESLDYSLQEFDNASQNSLDLYDNPEDANFGKDNFVQLDNAIDVDVIEQDETVLDDAQNSTVLFNNEVGTQAEPIQYNCDNNENDSTSGIELSTETSAQIYNRIHELDNKFPELHICDIFEYRYAQKYSILEITTMLNIDEYTVADALNKIISVIEDL